jgi:mannose-6-phosphate isomerase
MQNDELRRRIASTGILHSAFGIPHFMTTLPYRVEKPWGYELIWARTDRYVGKILHIEAGHLLSLQYHERKDESIYVLSGEIVLRLEQGETLIERRMGQGEAFHIQPKQVHQFEAVVTSDLIEASTPELDDVIRLKDRYGRVP